MEPTALRRRDSAARRHPEQPPTVMLNLFQYLSHPVAAKATKAHALRIAPTPFPDRSEAEWRNLAGSNLKQEPARYGLW